MKNVNCIKGNEHCINGNKRNILILGGRYANPLYANSICRQNLAEYLAKEEHEVYILASGYEYHNEEESLNGVWVKKIYGDRYGEILKQNETRKNYSSIFGFRILQFLHYLKAFVSYPKSPDGDYKQILKYSKDIIERFKIDTLVAMYRPYDCIDACIKLKKKYGDCLKVVTYHLDLMSEHLNANPVIVKYKSKRIRKAFKRELSTVDKVLLPGSAPYIDNVKVEYVDFPLYITDNKSKIDKFGHSFFSQDTINIAIVGTLDKANRNPEYICGLIERLALIDGKKINLHIWGAKRDVDFNPYTSTFYHGMADIKEVPAILGEADFLLNIGNKITATMIPSKIFQMFAAKKPIIFNVSSLQDKSVPYFKHYGYVCYIEEYKKNKDRDAEKIYQFIQENYNKELKVDDNLFEKSTPRYICQKILED